MIDSKAYKETFVIISAMSENLKKKIPLDILSSIEQKMDKNYDFSLEPKIKNTVLLNDTKKLLSVLYTDYIASDDERLIIKAKERSLMAKEEDEKKKKYGVDVFRKKI